MKIMRELKDIFTHLSNSDKKKLFRLQILMLITAFIEGIGLALIGPYVEYASKREFIFNNGFSAKLSSMSFEFELLIVSAFLLIVISLATIMTVLTNYLTLSTASHIGFRLSANKFNNYIKQNWLEFQLSSTASYTKNIATESQRMVLGVLMPTLVLLSRLTLILVLIIFLIYINPLLTGVAVSFIIGAYILIYALVKKKLTSFGHSISRENQMRFTFMEEAFTGFKELKLLGQLPAYSNLFGKTSSNLANAHAKSAAISSLPRFFMEFFVVFLLVLFVCTHLLLTDQSLMIAIPELSVFGLAAVKLLPALQVVYSSISTLRTNMNASSFFTKDDYASTHNSFIIEDAGTKVSSMNDLSKVLICVDEFRYPNSHNMIIRDACVSLTKGEITCLVGPSGSGKSTLVDIFSGLLDAQTTAQLSSGRKVDLISREWQSLVAYVPQQTFIKSASVLDNIIMQAPGEEKKVNASLLKRAIRTSNCDEFIDDLPDGIETEIGGNGAKLSGGQRQRLSIARAIYSDKPILILDESTSALDARSEYEVMKCLKEISKHKIILMIAHRSESIRFSDKIILVDNQTIIANGSFNELRNHENYKEYFSFGS